MDMANTIFKGKTMRKLPVILTYLGAAVLVLTALYHSYSFTSASQVASAEGAHPFTAYFLEPVWLLPSITWLILALMACLRPPRRIAVCIAAIPGLQAIMMFTFIGLFPGTIALAVSALLLLAGTLTTAPIKTP